MSYGNDGFSALLCEPSVVFRALLLLNHRIALAVMLPVQPINSFGKRQPMSRNVFVRLFEV